jgi:signal peptidase I
MDKPRRVWLAGLLSFFTIGLGHIYSGKAKRGVLLYFGNSVIWAIFLPLIILKFNAFILFLFAFTGFAYFICIMIDAIKAAKENSTSYILKKYNRWYIYLALFVFTNLVIQPAASTWVKEDILQAFKISSGGMIPTLLVGDHILVNKYIYKRRNPQRGDIVVFIPPNSPSKIYDQRTMGVGGDTIEIKNKQLWVNGVPQVEDYIRHRDPKIYPSAYGPRDNYGPVTVPPHQVFLLGDNRDSSFDSRYWGFLPVDKVIGKVMGLYWSWDGEKGEVRWRRVGKSFRWTGQ